MNPVNLILHELTDWIHFIEDDPQSYRPLTAAEAERLQHFLIKLMLFLVEKHTQGPSH